jgi:SAM-dependent methyltransferase
MKYPAKGSVRWYVSEFVRVNAADAKPPYLEVGSGRADHQWWRDIRTHIGVPRDQWTGLDMERGPNVDVEFDIVGDTLGGELHERFNTVICAEVLEHVSHPPIALETLWWFLKPGGKLIITVPFAFPIHNFPDDYWRFAPSGLKLLLADAGFEDIHTTQLNEQAWELDDHGERTVKRLVPMHIGAVARRPLE